MERTQREYYLNEQMKAIQKELGDGDDGQNEVTELEERLSEIKLSREAKEKAEAEIKKLKTMSPMSAEATVVRNYLDWILGIPWGVKSRVKKDLNRAQKTLDDDHYSLEKVKERIVEYLAVQQRSAKLKGPILCLVGPPGVGKTSLGKSVSKATGREFIRISLGGVRDESEIRGHRRTYIGSMPGKIIQALKKAKTINPLILLDEIDKMGQDFRGDPASAMLEVLDPEQNSTFVDHYMEVEYDLSNVMFLTTANSYNMPSPLLDRMEIITLAGYTEDEKREIARRHLIEKQTKNHGLRKDEFELSDDALDDIIRRYTREAGVRNLEREIAKLARKAVTKIVKRDVEHLVAAGNMVPGSPVDQDRRLVAEEALVEVVKVARLSEVPRLGHVARRDVEEQLRHRQVDHREDLLRRELLTPVAHHEGVGQVDVLLVLVPGRHVDHAADRTLVRVEWPLDLGQHARHLRQRRQRRQRLDEEVADRAARVEVQPHAAIERVRRLLQPRCASPVIMPTHFGLHEHPPKLERLVQRRVDARERH